MKLKEAYNELSVRYYRWRLKDADREIRQGYPFVRSIQDPTALVFLRMIESLSLEEQHRLLQTSIKLLHESELVNAGYIFTAEETPNADDRVLLKAYLDYQNESIQSAYNQIYHRTGDNLVRENMVEHALLVVDRLSAAFHKSFHRGNAPLERYCTVEIGDWNVETYVNLETRRRHYRTYRHVVKRQDYNQETFGVRRFMFMYADILVWLGIGGCTGWTTPFQVDVEPAVESLLQVCTHFMREVPALLEGLECDKA